MKHPDREEWIPYLFGEADPAHRTRLGRHLEVCPACASELSAWKRSLKQLDAWELSPAGPPKVRLALFPSLSWAVAAVFVLAIGVLIGRLSLSQTASLSEVGDQIEANLRATLESELQEAVDDLRTELASSVGASERRLASASYSENQRAWQALLGIMDAYRLQDVRAFEAALQRVESQSADQYVALRKDLETLASATDDEIRRARLSLMELASSAGPLEEP